MVPARGSLDAPNPRPTPTPNPASNTGRSTGAHVPPRDWRAPQCHSPVAFCPTPGFAITKAAAAGSFFRRPRYRCFSGQVAVVPSELTEDDASRRSAIEQNRRTYERMATAQAALCRPATAADLADPLAAVDQNGWLGGSIRHWRVLCLAAGGGRQSALYAAAGADVTVVDISPAMLQADRQMAAQQGLTIRTIEASMDHLPMLADGHFDCVVHPVSTCYLPDVRRVFAEVARLTRPGGLYISQHKQPVSLQASIDPVPGGGYLIRHAYYRETPIPPPTERTRSADRLRESGAVEYLHRWEQIVGGICRSGFVIEDLVEPVHAERSAAVGSFADRARYVAPYVRIKARRRGAASQQQRSKLLIP